MQMKCQVGPRFARQQGYQTLFRPGVCIKMSALMDRTIKRAQKLQHAGRHIEASKLLLPLLQQYPSNIRLRNILGLIEKDESRVNGTIDPPDKVLARLAALFEGREWQKLEIVCKRLLPLHPHSSPILNMLAISNRHLGNQAIAEEFHKKAIAADPVQPELFLNYGNSLRLFQKLKKAESIFKEALRVSPTDSRILNSLGCLCDDLGNHREAAIYFKKAVVENPSYAEAISNLGSAKLRDFDFANGWRLRESRWSDYDLKAEIQRFRKPQWDGRPTEHLFVWGEQGIGDEVMSGSCLDELLSLSKKLTGSVNGKSLELFRRSFPRINFIDRNRFIDFQFDDHIPSMSALGYLRQTKQCFDKVSNNFLKPEIALTQNVKSHLRDMAGKKQIIGVSWKSVAKRVGEKRSIPLNLLIEKIPTEAFLVNLQYGDVKQEILNAKRSTGVQVNQLEDLDLTDNMDHFAATIAACDSVVSVDNSTVHFAGGIGQLCRVLLPYSSDWRWGTRGEKASYWYPSLKLYWQEELNDWVRPLNQLKNDLKLFPSETEL